MADMEYDVVYMARSPAAMKQDDFAAMMDELCNERTMRGWRLVSAVGDYGARVTLGVWLYFEREATSGSDQPPGGNDADEGVPGIAGLEDDESPEQTEVEGEESP